MPHLENLKKQAKQLVRWHRQGNYSVAARIRAGLPRYHHVNDREILARPFTLGEAQLLLARESGFETWAEFTAGAMHMDENTTTTTNAPDATDATDAASATAGPRALLAEPQIFVSDVKASCAFFEEKLGFATAFTYGDPPFYAGLKRDGVSLNLRYVCEPVFVGDIREREQLLSASIAVHRVKELYAEFLAADVDFQQPLRRQPWGARNFVVRDPDGNLILFAGD
jgi:catechol 2,3-dioxygenase-like lactoylglutathione lyase family enzyme